ncbi:hemoglobin/transferrin/lactoferrin receptor protein [Lutibacter oricola]|uniref:Hemoglobin/transferrin/lactoferrin receptor protein n=1 Tax=Lutibacter oricola TaxID=762486 RepID=A0A1H2QHY4_9FLAO|nr:TonB-dependent receptor [Lutibacter oricola]SDW06488.1 hemoglobin/transferrin/lactoferrin receptor protein [Lutibacter oricola]
MKLNFTLLILLITVTFQAQNIRVLEYGTDFPVENVTIYNDSNTSIVYTDKNGIADLSSFKDNDIVSFQHISFIEYEILKKELSVVEFVIYLSKKAQLLDEIVLSASKGSEKRSRIAEQVAIVFNDDIKKIAPQTSADLLAAMPGVKVQKSQFGGGSPVLRGMEANRVLLVVDGVRMNNAIYRMGHLQNSITVSPNIIDRTEVIFGPSSVIYGSDALGGVIHYYTKTPKVSDNKQINSSVFTRYSSVNNEFTSEGNIEFRNKKWASFTSVSHSKFGDLKMGKNRNHGYNDWGKVLEYSNNSNNFYNATSVLNSNSNIQKNTGYSQFDVLQKLAIPLTDKTNILFNVQYSRSSNIDRFDKLSEYSDGTLKWAEWHYGPQKRLLISSQLSFDPNKKWLKNGVVTAAYQKINESRVQRKFSSIDRSYRKEDLNVFSLNGDFYVPLTKTRILSYGIEATHNDVESNSYGKTLDIYNNTIVGFLDDFKVQSRYPDGGSTYSSLAGYINYRQDINSKSTLNTGVRLINTYLSAKWLDDTFITLPDFDISSNNKAVTATIGYAYKPTKDWQLNTVISSGFRSPNIDDIGKIREKSGKVTVPNIYLKPEFAYNFETGVLKYFNEKRFQVGLNVYYTLLDNYITRDFFEVNNSSTILYDGEIGDVVANVNKDNAYIAGGTFSFKGDLTSVLYSKGSLTYTEGETYDTKLPMSSIPPLFGMVELGFEKERLQASVNWRFNSKKKYSKYNLIEGIDNIEQSPYDSNLASYVGTPAWNTLNVAAKYKFNNSITVFANLDNLFDVHYKEFASSISAPGRNISVSISAKI